MNDLVFSVGGVSLYATGLLVTFSYLWGSFVFYKKAVESHCEDEAVLDMIVLGAFWGFLVSRLVFVAVHLSVFWAHWSRVLLLVDYPGLDGWGFLIGLSLGVMWIVKKNKYKYIDIFDYVSKGFCQVWHFFGRPLALAEYFIRRLDFCWLSLALGSRKEVSTNWLV
jgi:prolipoprotein diacylglyceryltransferase